MNINRFTEKAQEALAGAQRAAEEAKHPQIDPEHLLAALIAQPGGVVPDVLRKLQVDPGGVGADVQQALAKLPKAYGATHAGFSSRLRGILQKAEGELARFKDEFVSTGLFLVRRDSTWMTRRISSSRPMTGSSLSWRASAVRSRP